MKIKLTSVKILQNLYNDFKHVALEEDVNLQKLVNRSLFLYVSDEKYRKKIEETDDLIVSSSKL
tara:strand:- start:414 stop:605 length:192 start_codon:yes stop_codon:yes gene_type:complete